MKYIVIKVVEVITTDVFEVDEESEHDALSETGRAKPTASQVVRDVKFQVIPEAF